MATLITGATGFVGLHVTRLLVEKSQNIRVLVRPSSQRRFIQLFSNEVGLTPKLFCRVNRFQRVVRSLASIEEVDWAEVALDCGYYDQAHFIHDFQDFAGITPSAYLEHCTEHLNHVPLIE